MIKKLVTIAALAMLLGSPTSYAGFETGNSLAQDCERDDAGFRDGFCYGYVISLFDTIQGVIMCAPDGVTRRQVQSIVKKYLKENPENLHLTANRLVTGALIEAFPCN